MPATRTYEETLHVAGTRADWLQNCVWALEESSFKRLRVDEQSFIVDADFTGLTIDGSIRLLMTQERDNVAIEIHIIAAVDNVWALRDPLQRILSAFKQQLLCA
jgi:hypothetical protein